MSTEAYAGLRRAARAEDPATPESETRSAEEETEADETEEETMTENTSAEALAEAKASGFAEANDRMQAVMASEHYAGREALAHKMLGNAKLSADEIIDTLGAAEAKAAEKPESSADDDEAKERAAMRQNLAEQPGSTSEEGELEAAANHGWDEIVAEVEERRAA